MLKKTALFLRLGFPNTELILTKLTLGSVFNGWIVRKFVFSKPPSRNYLVLTIIVIIIVAIVVIIMVISRKMITTDINIYFMITGNMMVVVHCISVTLRTLNGPLPIYAALFFRWN